MSKVKVTAVQLEVLRQLKDGAAIQVTGWGNDYHARTTGERKRVSMNTFHSLHGKGLIKGSQEDWSIRGNYTITDTGRALVATAGDAGEEG